MTFYKILKPTKQRQFKRDIFGFDIETYDDNKKFLCASIYSDNPRLCKTFFSKKEIIKFIQKPEFRGSYISATNLGFDYFGTFYGQTEENYADLLFICC